MKFLVTIFALAFFSAFAFGQATPPVEVPTADFLAFLFQSLGGVKGMSTLAIVGVVVQILIMFLKTPIASSIFVKLGGFWKLALVLTLTLVGGVLGLMSASGLSLGAALVHSTTLSAFMVLANEVYKHFTEKA